MPETGLGVNCTLSMGYCNRSMQRKFFECIGSMQLHAWCEQDTERPCYFGAKTASLMESRAYVELSFPATTSVPHGSFTECLISNS